MDRNSPVPLLAVLCIGVVALVSVYLLGQSQLLKPEEGLVVDRLSIAPSTIRFASATSSPTIAASDATMPIRTLAPDLREWGLYENSQQGFSFQYPLGWGHPSVGGGNRNDEEAACPIGGPLAIPDDSKSVPVYDLEVSFPRGPIVDVLTLAPNQNSLALCKDSGTVFDLKGDELELKNLSGPSAFVNSNGIKISTNPDYEFFDPGTEDDHVYIDQFYRFYASNLRVQAGLRASVTDSELKAFGCYPGTETSRVDCGRRWLMNSPAAQELRNDFGQFESAMESFKVHA